MAKPLSLHLRPVDLGQPRRIRAATTPPASPATCSSPPPADTRRAPTSPPTGCSPPGSAPTPTTHCTCATSSGKAASGAPKTATTTAGDAKHRRRDLRPHRRHRWPLRPHPPQRALTRQTPRPNAPEPGPWRRTIHRRSSPVIGETRRQRPANAPEATEELQEEHMPRSVESFAMADPGTAPTRGNPTDHCPRAPSHRSQ